MISWIVIWSVILFLNRVEVSRPPSTPIIIAHSYLEFVGKNWAYVANLVCKSIPEVVKISKQYLFLKNLGKKKLIVRNDPK